MMINICRIEEKKTANISSKQCDLFTEDVEKNLNTK